MKYNFDEIIDRENTCSFKYDYREGYFGTKDLTPMWVADMDFKVPDCVINAINSRVEHGIFGYSFRPESYFNSIIDWLFNNHQWKVEKDWIIDFPGVVPSLNMIVRALTNEGDKIIVQPPVYYPFFHAVEGNKRQLIINPLVLENNRYVMDIDNFKAQLDKDVKMFILCNPHNPGGRVWTKAELTEICQLCVENNILIISDEIHSDIVYEGNKYIPVANLNKEISDITITCISASKTFNIAALGNSSVIVSNDTLKRKLKSWIAPLHIEMGNLFGSIATEAAYLHGRQWLDELIDYLQDNLDLIISFFNKNVPGINVMKPEATYLAWLDCRDLNLNNTDLKELMIKKVKLGFNDGPVFGDGGEGFQRMNYACPRKILQESLEKISAVIL